MLTPSPNMFDDFVCNPREMPANAVANAAAQLQIEPALVKAVAEIESRRAPYFVIDGKTRPLILYEPFVFWDRIGHRLDNPPLELSPPRRQGHKIQYGSYLNQIRRLMAAMRLQPPETVIPALESCSWGRFQVMGYWARTIGWKSDGVIGLVRDIMDGHEAQFKAFIGYVQHNDLAGTLRDHRFQEFARGYNGPAHAKHDYEGRFTKAYLEHSEFGLVFPAIAGRAAGPPVGQLQERLATLGFEPGEIDQAFGPATSAAVKQFQKSAGLVETGRADLYTWIELFSIEDARRIASVR